ncbi:MAG: glycoside hydrolase family 43 protein [Tepidisphaeraceae bacterium]
MSTWSCTTPVIPQRADPYILRHNGEYLFTASVPEYDRIVLRRAKTIAGLANAEEKVIWRAHASGEMSWHIWAPEIHQIDGTWCVYFAAGERDDIWKIRIWVLSNSSPDPMEGEWTERGQIKPNWDSFSLDATVLELRGKRYLLWAQNDPKIGPGTSIYLAEMDGPTAIKGTQTRITTPEHPWEVIGHRVNEGPAVLRRNGRIFVTFSASATDHNYCMGLLWMDENADPTDPKSWHKKPEPIFCTTETAKAFGPGHNSFTVAEDGKTDLLVYHARPYPGANPDPLRDPNRHTRVQPFTWDSEGFPVFGAPLPESK